MPIYRELAQHSLRSIALEPALSVTSDTSLPAVVATMRNSDTDYVLVTKDEVLAGIFTEHDLLTRAANPDGAPDAPVGEFMSADPTVMDASRPISAATPFRSAAPPGSSNRSTASPLSATRPTCRPPCQSNVTSFRTPPPPAHAGSGPG